MTENSKNDPGSRSLRILLVDDNKLLAEGLTNLLTAYGNEVVGIASDGMEAIKLAETLKPDLILMDISMPRHSGFEATRRIKSLLPKIKIVMLTASGEDADLFESIKSGADGYLIKNLSGRELIDALQQFDQGMPPFSPGLAARMLNEFARLAKSEEKHKEKHSGDKIQEESREKYHSQLTQRQKEVLKLVASGLTYKEVGDQLSLSERTVRYHMAAIMERLHMEHRSQLLFYAGKRGLDGGERK
jgi:DNA-binding NarL/FixJ family response regulator